MTQLENIETAAIILDVNVYEVEDAIDDGQNEYKVSEYELKHILMTKIKTSEAINYNNTDNQIVLRDLNSEYSFILTRIK